MNVIQKNVFATEAVLDALIDSGLFTELDLDQGSPALALDIHDLLADRFLTKNVPNFFRPAGGKSGPEIFLAVKKYFFTPYKPFAPHSRGSRPSFPSLF